MARRGEALREHILDTAKAAFLEAGFERTSMDAVAARAETSKRSLYLHFPTKDVLVLAVIERSGELLRDRMLTPEHYADNVVEAVAKYCGRLLQLLGWSTVVRTCRLGIVEAERFPEATSGIYEALFGHSGEQLADYLCEQLRMRDDDARTAATGLLAQTLYPALPRLLFGLDQGAETAPREAQLDADVDMPRIREIVQSVLVPRPAD